MFAQTVSFWRKLVGSSRPQSATGPQDAEADRRVWVRYPTDLTTTLQPAACQETAPLAARVRDISRGGMHLHVGRPFQTGELLSVELPGEQPLTVLACIIRVNLLPSGEWELGCVFARELSDADLDTYGARREKPLSDDQRLWARFACALQANCQLVGQESAATLPGKVLNISATGIGLLVEKAVDTGTLLNMELVPSSGKPARTILACVVHSTHQPAGDGRVDAWALGCNFIRELTEQDLQNLV
jgi:hypothetical protein